MKLTDNVLALFLERVEQYKKKPWLHYKDNTAEGGFWKGLSWREVADRINYLAHYLEQLDLGSEPRIMVMSENRPEWVVALYAIWAMGGVVVPVMVGTSKENIAFIANDANVQVAIVSNKNNFQSLKPNLLGRKIKHIIGFSADISQLVSNQVRFHYFSQITHGTHKFQFGSSGHQVPLSERARSLLPSKVSTLLYTSGTSGQPKGVMLTQKSHMAVIDGLAKLFRTIPNFSGPKERFLSFLPLSHCYEFHVILVVAMNLGAKVYFAESLEKLRQNMLETKPTIMTAVPRLYQLLYEKISANIANKKPMVRNLVQYAIRLGTKKALKQKMSLIEKLMNLVMNMTIRRGLRKIFGGKLKLFISGGAPLQPEVGAFVSAMGVRVLQGYGLTEATIAATVNLPFDERMDSVGRPLQGVKIKIADDGEICLKGDTIMQGYWRNQKATKEAFDSEGYLKTGDIGKISDGHLLVVDRKKDIIVNSGGENIAPQKVENILQLEPEIKQAMVYGDNRSYLVALLVADDETLKKNQKDKNKLQDVLNNAIGRANKKLAKYERIRKFFLCEDPFTVDNEMLSPNLKLRRHVILDKYQKKINSLYH